MAKKLYKLLSQYERCECDTFSLVSLIDRARHSEKITENTEQALVQWFNIEFEYYNFY